VLIDRRLNERGYALPLQIPAHTQVTKSAFFPITSAPTRLVVNYSSRGDVREISLELPELAGLHLEKPLTPSGSPCGRSPPLAWRRRTLLFMSGVRPSGLSALESCRIFFSKKMPAEGFEPPTYGLQNRCTTTVLSRLGS
jgi:hypothetical protein